MLKLNDIVSRASLNERTARYVLDRAGGLGLPTKTGTGNHRLFSPESAARFSLCVLLVMYGIPLDTAVETTQWCEKRVRAMTRANRSGSLYESNMGDPWTLTVLHAKYGRVWRHKDHELMDEDEFYAITEQKKVRLWEIPTVLHQFEINLTVLEARLMRD